MFILLQKPAQQTSFIDRNRLRYLGCQAANTGDKNDHWALTQEEKTFCFSMLIGFPDHLDFCNVWGQGCRMAEKLWEYFLFGKNKLEFFSLKHRLLVDKWDIYIYVPYTPVWMFCGVHLVSIVERCFAFTCFNQSDV